MRYYLKRIKPCHLIPEEFKKEFIALQHTLVSILKHA